MPALRRVIAASAVAWIASSAVHAQDITAAQLLQGYSPRRTDAVVETPTAAELPKCTREVVKEGNSSSWVVYGPAGQVLRRFSDTDGDGKVDQFRFYNLGVEVYRDIDSDGNEGIDQHRWLNSGGTRWAIDRDEDGKIDHWKRISAPEAAQVAVTAMIAGDAQLLSTVLVSAEDIRALALRGDFARKVQESVSEPATKMQAAVSRSPILAKGSQWMRFDAQSPGLVPAGRVSDNDLVVYQNAMAMVDMAGNPGLVQIGELVQVGDAWKLVGIPQPSEGSRISMVSILMQPELMNAAENAMAGPATTPEMQKLLDQLQELDRKSPSPADGARALARYNQNRAGLLARLAAAAPNAQTREEWTRQLADGVAAAVQTPGGWAEGLDLLRRLENEILADAARSKTEILPYVVYRRLLAEYATRLQTEDVEARQRAQEWWLEQLPDFSRKYPDAPDSAEALIELAKNQEFLGKLDEAEKWYRQVATRHPRTPGGRLAAGALRRLGLEGKSLVLAGQDFQKRSIDISQYRGKVVLVAFWTTWCRPCTQELPQLIQLHARYQKAGFEVLGVNLDDPNAPVDAYLRKYQPRWNHIHDGGGMQGTIAQQYGIISLPTMFLVGRNGQVLSRSISLSDLQETLPNVLQGQPLRAANGKSALPPAARGPNSRK